MKGFYRIVLNWIFHLAGKMNRIKMWVFEWYSIIRKRHIYKNIRWTSEQQRQFDDFWKENYGRKISPRWHKLYQAFNGVFNAAYIPEILYTAGFEPRMNDCIYVKALEDKAFVESYTGKTDVVVPETIFSKSGGLYRDKDYNIITLQEAMDKLAGGGKVVLKPTVGGSSGKGVLFFDAKDDRDQLHREIEARKDGEYIVQRAIRQHPVFEKLHPESVNTIRMITYICDGRIECTPISMRIGMGQSHLDNIHAGGVVVGVRPDGRLLKTGYQLGYGDTDVKMTVHPDSGVEFDGYQLPCIPKMIEQAKKIHAHFTHVGFVSFDFTVDCDENIVLIETNLMAQGVWFPQIIHGESLFGENVKAMLKAYRAKKL